MTPIEKLKESLKELKRQLQILGKKNRELQTDLHAKKAYDAIQHTTNTPSNSLVNLFKKTVDLEDEKMYDAKLLLTEDIDYNVNFLTKTIGEFQDSFSEDRAVKYISIAHAIETLYYVRCYSKMSLEDLAVIFGLIINADYEYLLKNRDAEPDDMASILILRNYFAEDGSFRYNENVSLFEEELALYDLTESILEKTLDSMLDRGYPILPFAKDFKELLIKNNEKILVDTKSSAVLRVKDAIWTFDATIDESEEEKDATSPTISRHMLLSIVASIFDHEKVVSPLEIAGFLHTVSMCITEISIDSRDFARCLGMLVHVDIKKGPNNRFYFEKHEKELRILQNYFNEDGSFKENPRVNEFWNTLYNISKKDFKKTLSDTFDSELRVIPDALRKLLIESNEAYRLKHREEKKRAQEAEAREKISIYYTNHRVVQIPFLLKEFYETLRKCGFSIEEESTIRRHIENRIEARGLYINAILDEEELDLYLTSKRIVASLQPDDPDYFEIRTALKNLSSLGELHTVELDEDEREYLKAEKAEIMDYLTRFVNRHRTNEEGEVDPESSFDRKPFTIQPLPKK